MKSRQSDGLCSCFSLLMRRMMSWQKIISPPNLKNIFKSLFLCWLFFFLLQSTSKKFCLSLDKKGLEWDFYFLLMKSFCFWSPLVWDILMVWRAHNGFMWRTVFTFCPKNGCPFFGSSGTRKLSSWGIGLVSEIRFV